MLRAKESALAADEESRKVGAEEIPVVDGAPVSEASYEWNGFPREDNRVASTAGAPSLFYQTGHAISERTLQNTPTLMRDSSVNPSSFIPLSISEGGLENTIAHMNL